MACGLFAQDTKPAIVSFPVFYDNWRSRSSPSFHGAELLELHLTRHHLKREIQSMADSATPSNTALSGESVLSGEATLSTSTRC